MPHSCPMLAVLDRIGRKVVVIDHTDPVALMRWSNAQVSALVEHSHLVCKTQVGEVEVSTVFLGMNTSMGRPLWFETMIFGGAHDRYQRRASTWAEAEEEHARALALARPS